MTSRATIDALDREIRRLSARMDAACYEQLVLIREFDELARILDAVVVGLVLRSDAQGRPTAIATSRPEPVLRNWGGARLTTIFFSGHRNPADITAARTRSRASRHDSSGKPNIVNAGKPCDTCTSTVTTCDPFPSSSGRRCWKPCCTTRKRLRETFTARRRATCSPGLRSLPAEKD